MPTGHTDDFMPGVPARIIGVGAGILAWAGIALLVQGAGAIVWVAVRLIRGAEPFPSWLIVTVGVPLHIGILAAAIATGRRTTRWVRERRGGHSI